MINFTRWWMLGLLLAGMFWSCATAPHRTASYLFVWAGDDNGKASDFLGVIDADPASPRYATPVASIATGTA